MTAAEASPVLAGCDLSMLDSAACERYLGWLLGEKEANEPEGARGLAWALAHCDDGVTWGRHDASAKVWHFGNQAIPEVSPSIRPEALQELRVFGEAGEVLIWRTDAGLRGRMLLDASPGADRSNESDFLRPSNESRILRGDHVVEQCEHGFSRVGDRTGAEQVLPLEVTKEQLHAAQVRLEVRHYYQSDADTGAVRIAATRLVTLTAGGSHGA
jgi:CRISPR-associated protein (TIGR03984 family)